MATVPSSPEVLMAELPSGGCLWCLHWLNPFPAFHSVPFRVFYLGFSVEPSTSCLAFSHPSVWLPQLRWLHPVSPLSGLHRVCLSKLELASLPPLLPLVPCP